MGKGLYAIVAVAVLGLAVAAAQADGVTTYTNDFTGTDGVSVIGDSWGYVDLGVENADWTVGPRTAPADRFEISNNSLFAKVTPLETTDPKTYNKVMASIYAKTNGSQISLTMGDHEKAAYEVDLTNVIANPGNKWGLNQQFKLVFTNGANMFNDPNTSFDSFVMSITARRINVGETNALTIDGLAFSGGVRSATTTQTIAIPAVYPYKLRMTVDKTGLAEFFYNDTTTPFGTLQGTAMTTVNPYLWFGKFNGDGDELADGNFVLDNYNVALIPDGKKIRVLGDANNDDAVTDADYTIWADTYNFTVDPDTGADFNMDGQITDADYTLWADHYGEGTGNVVPEPATMSLLGLGLFGLLRRRA